MSDISVAAPAASEGASAPVIPNAPQSQPLGSQTPMPEKAPEPAPKPEGPSKSAAEAVKRASDKLAAKAAEEKTAKPVEKPAVKADPTTGERARAEDGKFAPKEPAKATEAVAQPRQIAPAPNEQAKSTAPHRDPPARFSSDAKAEWETAPESVKAEVHRAVRELEEGHQKYRESAERYEKVREYDDLARKNGREGVHESLKQVVEIENAFQRSPIEGFQRIADHFGISLRAVAAHIMGQDPQQTATKQDQTIQQLRSQIEELRNSVGTVTKTFEQQKSAEVLSKVDAFAKENPRFEELAEDITFFLTSGKTSDLAEAYKLAERLNPAASASPAQPAAPAPTTAPLSPAGLKSISGAPSSGSNPANRDAPVSSSAREALERAMKRVG